MLESSWSLDDPQDVQDARAGRLAAEHERLRVEKRAEFLANRGAKARAAADEQLRLKRRNRFVAKAKAAERKRQLKCYAAREKKRQRARAKIRERAQAAKRKCWVETWKRQQRLITRLAISDGRLTRGPCHLCQTPRSEHRIQAHHWDYAKPFDVYFVCERCHLTVHRVLAAVQRAGDDEIKRLPASVYG